MIGHLLIYNTVEEVTNVNSLGAHQDLYVRVYIFSSKLWGFKSPYPLVSLTLYHIFSWSNQG